MTTLELTPSEASTAASIQKHIDSIRDTGGLVVLPKMDITIDRGIELRSGIELIGQGPHTIIRKGPARIYPLTGYHNYGMCDVPVENTDGLDVGMTVSIGDDGRHGYYGTLARVTWISDGWVGLNRGISADYLADANPCLTTAYPMLFAHRTNNIAVRNLVLDGRLEDQAAPMNGCRGSSIYFYQSRNIEVSGVAESNYHGEGMGFQMCLNVLIENSQFCGNTGNGIHPGSGTTNALVRNCTAAGNKNSGFFFCVRATHITVSDCIFEGNGDGVSIGTRDCHNTIERCRVADNSGPGVFTRQDCPQPVEVHSCMIRDCRIEGNARKQGVAQVVFAGPTHDMILENCTISASPDHPTPGIVVEDAASGIFCANNTFSDCMSDIEANPDSLTMDRPSIECGKGSTEEHISKHLDPYFEG